MSNKTPKKILYIITKSNWGGAQKYVYELAMAAKETGYEVEVGCGGTGKAGAALGPLTSKLNESAIKVHHIKYFMRNMSFFSDLFAVFEVWQLVRKIKPDVLHVTSSKAGGVGAFVGRLTNTKKIIFTSHGLTTDEIWRPYWQRILIYVGTWLTLTLSHHSIMITSETTERAKKMPGLKNKVFLIKNGISPIEFIEKNEARKIIAPNISTKTFWIGGIGELHPNKNWQAAIEAMINLPEEIKLFIIGEGEERQKLEKAIKEKRLQNRVFLVGFLNAPPYLKAFDIFLLPSLKEGLPYVLLEAGQAGLPIVASNLPGNQDIIDTGENGFLIEPNPKLISTTLQMLIRDEGMRKRLSANIKEKIDTSFSTKNMSNQTFSLYV